MAGVRAAISVIAITVITFLGIRVDDPIAASWQLAIVATFILIDIIPVVAGFTLCLLSDTVATERRVTRLIGTIRGTDRAGKYTVVTDLSVDVSIITLFIISYFSIPAI